MKRIRISLSVVVLLFFVGNFNGFAQGSIKEVKGATDTKKELREEAAKVEDAAKEVQDKGTSASGTAVSVSKESSEQVALIKEKLKKTTDPAERKALMAEINRLKGVTVDKSPGTDDKGGDVRDGQSIGSGTSSEVMKRYEKVLKDASPEERAEIEAKMRELKKQQHDGKGAVSGEVEKVKDKTDKAKKYSDLKGREYGNARATDARNMIEKKEAKMAKRDQFVASGKDRVSAAKAKVQSDLDSDKINKEEAVEKLAKIAKAEQSLKDYEAKVREGKKKLADHKSQVSGYIKD